MSGDVSLSQNLWLITSMLQQSPMITKPVTVSCGLCETLRRRCAELELQIGGLQSALLSRTPQGYPDKRLVDDHFVGVPGNVLVSSKQEDTIAAIDGWCRDSSPFCMMNGDEDHKTNISEDEDCEILSQAGDNSNQPSTNCGQSDNDHLCCQTCASLAATNEDYEMECAEKEKLQREVEKLLSQLKTSKTENEQASQLWKKFEKEVHCLRGENQDLRDAMRKMKMQTDNYVTVVPAITPQIGAISTSSVRNEIEKVPGDKKTRQRTLNCDGLTGPAGWTSSWTCSTCQTKQAASWKDSHCENCGRVIM